MEHCFGVRSIKLRNRANRQTVRILINNRSRDGYYHDGRYAEENGYYHEHAYDRDDYQSEPPGIDVNFRPD